MLSRFVFLVLVLTLGSSSFVEAQVTVLRAKRMLDVRSGAIVADPVIVIEDGRIKAVGGPVPEGAREEDLGDATLLPGLIDAHVHLTMQLDRSSFVDAVRYGTADAALLGARYGRLTLLAGFTTVRNVGSADFVDVALKRAFDSDVVAGPRIVPAGHGLSITGGHGDASGFKPGILEDGPEQGVADGVEEVVQAVRYQIKHGAKVIKISATAGVLSYEESVGAQQYSEEEMRVIVEEASRHEIPVAAHAQHRGNHGRPAGRSLVDRARVHP